MNIRSTILLLVFALFPVSGWAQISLTIMDSHDDAEEDIDGPNAGDVRRTSSDLEIDNENGVEQWVGLRFQDVFIPSGAIITHASIQFTANETDVGSLTVPIYGELSPFPVQFSDIDTLTGRPLTTGFVDWTIAPWFKGDSGPNTTTPDLAAMVQEIIDQPDWVSGNPIAFLIQNSPTDTSERIAVSFDGNPLLAATLSIDFAGVARVESVDAVLGTFLSGQVSDLDNSDDVYLRYQRGAPFSPRSPSIWLEFSGKLSGDNPSELNLFFESQVSDTGIVQNIEMFNFNTGTYELVDSRDATRDVDSIAEVTLQGDLSRFVQAGSHAVKTKVTYTAGGVGFGFAWRASIDQLIWQYQ